MQFLTQAQRDTITGLVTSGHVADWGDVSSDLAGPRATTRYAASQTVVGIYVQAMAFHGMIELARLLDVTGHGERSQSWRREAAAFERRVQDVLWDGDRGYFSIHRHVGFPEHDGLREADIFPMGGNAVAILAGLATPAQAQSIIDVALERSSRFQRPTIGATLLPAYPRNFFADSILDEPYEYQNGGQWDWFAGRMIHAMFNAERPEAVGELNRAAAQVMANGGFHEWYTPDGQGRGSKRFAAGAAAIASSVIEGLFGVEWIGDRITIRPRLGLRNGYLYLPQPASSRFFAYRHDVEGSRLHLRVATNVRTVRVELPSEIAERAVHLASVSGDVSEARPGARVIELTEPHGIIEIEAELVAK
jgi:hypothetical protein